MIISLDRILLHGSNELTFRILINQKTLLFLQVGFTTLSCHQEASMVAFDSRSKTSIHFSPFSTPTSRGDSIVSVALSRSDPHRPEGGCYPLPFSSIN